MKFDYRAGGEGFCRWADENVCVPIYPPGSAIPVWTPMNDLPAQEDEHGRSYKKMWENQKEICRQALRMENNRFVHRLVIFCWPRGEGKSLLACLIQLWKFFNWPRQQIMLGANSKDQVKFVHYDIKRDVILHSPNLIRAVGAKNIQEKEIRFKGKKGGVNSKIRSISSFTGIVSNITGYTFSEMFDMKNPTFFVQLDGSIRGIPNALGVIDSTVSTRQHILHQLFSNQDKTPTLFFSYRYSKTGDPKDYWNPNMSEEQLQDYRTKFPFGEVERYFLNLWSAGAERVFSPEMIEATNFFGIEGRHDHKGLMENLVRKTALIENEKDLLTRNLEGEVDIELGLWEIDRKLWPVSKAYKLKDQYSLPRMATVHDLETLSEIYDTDWVVTGGIDRADPMKTRTGARTIVSFMAKGLAKSRSEIKVFDEEGAVPEFIYVLLHLVNVEDHSLESLKTIISAAHSEYRGIDMMTGERWGIWDLAKWCEDNDIPFETVYPTYDRQKGAFSELFLAYNTGRFKTPPLAVGGHKMDDLLKEEASVFDHDPDRRWFGSPQKDEKYGIQDDAMYSLGWNFYGAKLLTIDDFRPRVASSSFGLFMEPDGKLYGNL